ncbi:delta 5 fatty acid desaturase [Nannochloropsis gaditana CCMP526]|nr:delta 5 fatty acid desaturase [Nannochloropsis gaditana CCMP526]EKU21754.1 delta 5 fatty acid desaturase [Nannochloropsis gaditana CCMP526]|eukprot:XP_005854602.1 delta 5 fatty acid desaturase [Nannochloropsis gaditana CCMP526]
MGSTEPVLSTAAVPATEPAGKSYTWQEVAEHNTEKSLWVTVRGKVYDISSWVDNHPGGKEILLLAAGRDITYAFDSYHPFTEKPTQVLNKFEIGRVTSYEFPQYKADTRGFYKALCTRVNDYFVAHKLNPKDPIPGIWRMCLVALVALASFVVCNGYVGVEGTWAGTTWARLVAAVVFGICQALPLLHVMHDSSHLAFGNTERWWQVGGRLAMDFFAGANMTSWHNQHVIGHHIYTNVFLADPDLPDKAAGDPRRLVQKQAWQAMYKWQHLYLPPLYGILGIKFRVQDIMETFGSGTNGPVRVNPLSFFQWAEMIFTKMFWAGWRIAFPLLSPSFHTGWAAFSALFLVSEFMTGYFLAFNFQVSHVSSECDYPLGEAPREGEDGNIVDEWAVSQIKSSVDYAHNNPVTTFLCGALNYQVTHHLFPTVSQYHYPAIAPIIQDVCREFNVDYKVLPDFVTAFHAHIAHLKTLGERGEAAEVHMG